MNTRQRYPSDLTDAQWKLLEPWIPAVKMGGRRATYSRREIVNALLFVTRTGCARRHVPHDLPPWSLVYNYFWPWRKAGIWEKINDQLRGDLREKLGRDREPSAAAVDSQSVKTTEKGGAALMAAS
jgi:transposase